jgi:formamidase
MVLHLFSFPIVDSFSLTRYLGVYATSRHIPGVRFAGVTHPGLIGTAPSPELLAKWNEREVGLIQANASAMPPVGFAPLVTGAYVGQDGLDQKVREKIYREGARTIPGREHGGNCDVRFWVRS